MKSSLPHQNLPLPTFGQIGVNGASHVSQLLEIVTFDNAAVLSKLGSRLDGLTAAEAKARLKRFGLNAFAREKRQSGFMRLLSNARNPLVLLLLAIMLLCYMTLTQVVKTWFNKKFGE